jgi:site-specific recombinase XerD
MKHQNPNGNLDLLGEELLAKLICLRYKPPAIKRLTTFLNRLKRYATDHGYVQYSADVGCGFLADMESEGHRNSMYYQSAHSLVWHLDEVAEGREFHVRRQVTIERCPRRFSIARDAYVQALRMAGNRESTVCWKMRYTERFLERLSSSGLTALEEIDARTLASVLTESPEPAGYLISVRLFLRHLHECGTTATDLSAIVPRPRSPLPLPEVYTHDEVRKVLGAADRDTIVGRRDYAVLMLASHLGLRSSDIVGMSLTDIDWERMAINIIQVKTGVPLSLPLGADVGDALSGYIQDGRPDTGSDKVILSVRAPHFPLTGAAIHGITKKHIMLAGVAKKGRKLGAHALRMSYATALADGGAPYTVIAKALGHDGYSAANSYVRLGAEQLRRCAIAVPRPTGAFAAALGFSKEVCNGRQIR